MGVLKSQMQLQTVAFPMGKVVFANANPTQNTTLPIARQENGCKSRRLHVSS
jgi:hypothetical protein